MRHRVNKKIAELLVEVAVVRAPSEFAIRYEGKSEPLLQPDHLDDRSIFRLPHRVPIDLAPDQPRAFIQERARA
jgi:hypothetical protein